MPLRKRRKTIAAAVIAIGAGAVCLIAVQDAVAAYPERVRSACKGEYYRFCPRYPEGSPKLRACIRSNARSLTQRCARALIDTGLVSKREAQRLRR